MRELFDALERPVELLVARGPEETPLPGARDIDFGAETRARRRRAGRAFRRVTCRVEEEPAGLRALSGVAVLPEGEDVGIRYYGLPWGYELGSLIGAVLEAGRRSPRSGRSRSSASPRSTTISRSTSSSRRPDRIARRPCCWRTKRRSHHRGFGIGDRGDRVSGARRRDGRLVGAAIVVNGVPQWDGAVPERVFLDRILAPAFE